MERDYPRGRVRREPRASRFVNYEIDFERAADAGYRQPCHLWRNAPSAVPGVDAVSLPRVHEGQANFSNY